MRDPLWMPKGSVRALLALTVVLVIMGRYAATGEEPATIMRDLVLAVVGGYFVVRGKA